LQEETAMYEAKGDMSSSCQGGHNSTFSAILISEGLAKQE